MNRFPGTLIGITVMLVAIVGGCLTEGGQDGGHDSDQPAANGGEHDRDGDDGHGEEGEESGTELALSETYDEIRSGARLIMAYDAARNMFIGTVENTTAETLLQVRVEVHLSNGRELGPTPAVDLGLGEVRDVELQAESTDFDGWTAHPEVGAGEHGSSEGTGEHDREGEGEH